MIFRAVTWCFIAFASLPLPALELSFRAASAEFETAALEYEKIWAEDGERIISALETYSGTVIADASLTVVVAERQSNSGFGGRPMVLRASYPEPVKRGTLVHELGHRFLARLPEADSTLRVHQKLNLLLLPVWESLWGAEFVANQVAVESTWSEEYRRSWVWAMALTPDQQKHEWNNVSAR